LVKRQPKPDRARGTMGNRVFPAFGEFARLPTMSDPKDLAEARRRIAQEAEEKTGALNLSRLKLTELPPEISALTHLKVLQFWDTQVNDLTPLSSLTALQHLECDETQVSDLTPLSSLTALQHLNCSGKQVRDLTPLSSLTALQHLACSGTQLNDLTPLSSLTALQHLECRFTEVSDLTPLSSLTALQHLDCRYTQVSDLTPLSSLSALEVLHCHSTGVKDLKPLVGLDRLRSLSFDSCKLENFPEAILFADGLEELILAHSRISDIPPEVLSPPGNCLHSLRAHVLDLKAGAEPFRDVKLMVLGNGRSGKTQLCRMLAEEDFQTQWDSTHGIRVANARLGTGERDDPIRLSLWDFGGQDLYHGTHALFLRTRAIFVIVWSEDTDNAKEYEHQGITFRNHPLSYWAEYVRRSGGEDSTVLIVQTKCDSAADEIRRKDLPDEVLKAFGFTRELYVSAANGRGREALQAALLDGFRHLAETHGIAQIGASRLKLQRRIQDLRKPDGSLPENLRLIDQQTFRDWCAAAGGVHDPARVLAYLNNAGVVFYRKGLFEDRIVLDQAWALNAIYAVFDRTRSFEPLRGAGGRFTRPLLAGLVWDAQGYSEDEQRLFLSMMQSSGICFVYRWGGEPYEQSDQTVYIAPDLLPDRAAVETEVQDRWGVEPGEAVVRFDYPLLHAGLMRGLISRIGARAGLDAVYWRGGVYLYEATTRSRALIEQEGAPHDWQGTVRIETRGPGADDLLNRLMAWVEEENQRLGLAPEVDRERQAAKHVEAEEQPDLKITREPAEDFTYCVSYAWGDDTVEGKARQDRVDALCLEARDRGLRILRDTTDAGLGDSLTEFMAKLAEGRRVFIILSDKYLRSPNCTYELFLIWKNCRMDDAEFMKRVRIFKMPEVKISSLKDRRAYQKYWKAKLAEDKAEIDDTDISELPPLDLERYQKAEQFTSELLKILGVVSDRLQPREWDDFLEYGFEDPA
jgi:internalin A